MTKEEYLSKQEELRNQRGEHSRRHREIMSEIECKHHEYAQRERERYLKARREEKNAYDEALRNIESQAMALKAEWMEQHPYACCPVLEKAAGGDTNADRIARQMGW